jgi:hypothetical protein
MLDSAGRPEMTYSGYAEINVPLSKAMEHMQRFSSLVTKHQETPELARMIARACYRAK